MRKGMIGKLFCAVGVAALIMAIGDGAETAQAASQEDVSDTTQQDALEKDEDDLAISIFEGPYELENLDGQKAIGYEVTNDTDDNIYAGLVVQFMDRFNENIGASSAFIPCIASGESAYIYVVDNCMETFRNYTAYPFFGTSDYASATEVLSESVITEEEEDAICFYAENTSSEAIYLPQITIVYQLDSEPVAIYSGMLTDENGNDYLDVDVTGSVNFGCPEEYDDYIYYMTAIYDFSDNNGAGSSSDASDTVEDEDVSDEGEESSAFVAQGKTSLFNFMSACIENGCEYYNPNNNNGTVTATAEYNGSNYNIRYIVQDQRVYSVTIYAGNEDNVNTDDYKNCVAAFAKSLNSSLENETALNLVDQAIENPGGQIIDSDTLFRYVSSDNAMIISY